MKRKRTWSPCKITGQCVTARMKKIKAAVHEEPKPWHVFIGQLLADKTEKDLEEFLAEANIEVVKCNKLLATKNGTGYMQHFI